MSVLSWIDIALRGELDLFRQYQLHVYGEQSVKGKQDAECIRKAYTVISRLNPLVRPFIRIVSSTEFLQVVAPSCLVEKIRYFDTHLACLTGTLQRDYH